MRQNMQPMKRNSFLQTCGLAVLAAGAVFLTGCKTGPKPFNVAVEMDASFTGQRVPVDLVGVNANQRRQWEEISVTDYWGDADPLRSSGRKHTLEFSKPGETQKLSATDAVWEKWIAEGGAEDVFVIADLPGMGKPNDARGDADPRRRILPLNPKAWVKGTEELKVIITRGGLEVVTRQRPR
jgi:hypothetical protein